MLVCGHIITPIHMKDLIAKVNDFKMFYLIIVKQTDKTNGMI